MDELTTEYAALLAQFDGTWEYEVTSEGIRMENSAGNVILAPNLDSGIQAALALYGQYIKRRQE